MNASKLRRQSKRILRAAKYERLAYLRSLPIRQDTVFYESFAGNGVLCNPEAIFRYLLDHPDFEHLRHVWAIKDPRAIRRFKAEFRDHPRVRFVPRGGYSYWRALSTSRVLFNNATFPPAFGKRESQLYVNTWHGTPLKRMGFDIPDGAIESANTLRNFLMADYLLAANDTMREQMYEGAYRLCNIYRGRIIEEGYPRIDRQMLTEPQGTRLREELREAGITVGELPLVLYAPTWRGTSFADPEADAEELLRRTAALQAGLGSDFRVLLRPHQAVQAVLEASPTLARDLVPSTIPTNVLLGAAAGLVTDYSSVLFDFLATGRPIAFLTPDADEYTRARGTYSPIDELPGPISADAHAVGGELRALMHAKTTHPRYAEWAARFAPFEDGRATERIVDVVFRGRVEGRRVHESRQDGRTRILLYLGGMRSNGITSSALNLLRSIDHDAYDVTAVMPRSHPADTAENRALIDPAVRQVLRVGGMNGSKLLQLQRRIWDRSGTSPAPGELRWHQQLWNDEWGRMFGSAEFEWVADFSGYDPFWANLLLHSPDATRAIWLHTEMTADRVRTVNGKQPFRRKLDLVFSLYRAFDQLASVSPSLTRLNSEQLAQYAPVERFRTVRNFPSIDRVRAGAQAPIRSLLVQDEVPPEWMLRLEKRSPDERWFVNVGRLSPAKNQLGLIRAFAQVHARNRTTSLIIVGGGPLEQELHEEIGRHGLEHAVFLTGARDNPFPILQASDCFVLSSLYEGQPMVLLEAAILGLPIISTAFATVEDALPGSGILIVPQSEEALTEGMSAFLGGEVHPATLDTDAYVSEVAGEFAALIRERLEIAKTASSSQ